MPHRRLDRASFFAAQHGEELEEMRIRTALGFLALLSVAGVACSSKSDEPGSSSSSGSEKVKKKADKAGDKVDEASEDVGDKVEEATE
jgi:hypothetical protein